MRVLIVDDHEFALDTLEQALRHSGHDVIRATNGEEALELLRTGASRMVITDWMMPEMDGLELCRKIRQDMFGPYVYIVLLTARKSSADVVAGLTAGADEFLVKPFEPTELAVRIHAAERILSIETRDVAIFALAKLAESRDPETGEHLERIRHYATLLARRLQTAGQLEERIAACFPRLIHLTSPLHDIGKVGIPDSVLLKPGRLSDREFNIMKSHTTIGAETLDAALRQYPGVPFLEMARDIALSHHERFDGTGYPRGLAGYGIPLCGRVVALADVYDALTSKRVYKNAFEHDVAYGLILNESGRHFDPAIVDAFIQCESEFIAVRGQFAESEMVQA